MGVKAIIFSISIVSIIGLGIVQIDDIFSKKDSIIQNVTIKYVRQLHYNPKDIDDDFSENMFIEYLNHLDGGRRFLTQEDIQSLSHYKYRLDDEINENKLYFFDESLVVLEEAIKRAEEIYTEIIKGKFNFEIDEELELDQEKRGYAKDDDELKDFWRKYLKYEILTRLQKKLDAQEEKMKLDTSANGEELELKSEAELIEEAREGTKKMFSKYFERIKEQRRVDWFSAYINTITNVMDPHSGYFKPKDKADFDMRMSNRLEGIGARLTTDNNYVKVVSLVPGGPAWKGKELKEDDLILKVAQDGEEPVDVIGMHIDDVVSKVRGDKGTKVLLTVKHTDETVEDIEIIRDVIEFEEGYAKSFIIEDSTTQMKAGYIHLPAFYTDFSNNNAPTSSEDVKKELGKLIKENVDGVILDLRNNGGGSLRDVVEMAGLFIEKGPIVQVKSRRNKPYVLSDKDESVIYDGPLIILVNHFSASASEIMAAAMQDYGRAVIIGASNTFGKGTVQRFYNLDDALNGDSKEFMPLGEVKLTTQKYYRVDGGSVQLKGVIPHIVVPDRFNYIDVGERDYDFTLDWTKIDPAKDSYSQDIYKYNLPELKARSERRIADNNQFSLVEQSALHLEEMKKNSSLPLNIRAYEAYKKTQDEFNDKYNPELEEIPGMQVINLELDHDRITKDSTAIERNKRDIDGLSKDFYVKEAINVLRDIVSGGLGMKE